MTLLPLLLAYRYKGFVKIPMSTSLRRYSSKCYVDVTEDTNKRVATIKLNRPPVNCCNLELIQQITSAIKDMEKKEFRGIVLSSTLPSTFCAGLDIMELYQPKEQRFRQFWKSIQEMWKTLYSTPLITMAAINGHAPALGCGLVLSCDYRVMVNSKVTVGLNETRLGIMPPRWLCDLMIDTIGYRRAEKALYLGELFTPEQALSLNIVDKLAANVEEMEKIIQDQMAVWLQIPDHARRLTKHCVRKPSIDKLNSYAEQEVEEKLHLILLESTQKALHKYIENLRSKNN